MPPGDEEDLRRRAFSAYFRTGAVNQPSGSSGVVIVQGLKYVHLHNGGGTLAVYRVDTVGRLKRLKRWPKGIDRNG